MTRNAYRSGVFAAVSMIATHAGAQIAPNNAINLRCDGTAVISKEGYGAWPKQTERISVGFSIDPSSGAATMSGLPLISRLADPSPLVFSVKSNAFSWSARSSVTTREFVSSIEIDRYSATMEAAEFVTETERGKESIWTKSVRATCKAFTERAF